MKNLILVAILISGIAAAQAPSAPPSAVAIRNAKIYPVSGPVMSRATVVVRNGLIEAIGANVAVPGDAFVIEGEGLTVYPGLIDGLGTWGLESGAAAATNTGGRAGGRGQTPATPNAITQFPQQQQTQERSWGPEDRPRTTSWLRAADMVRHTDRRLETARSIGYTASVTFPTSGIFAGQGAVVALAGDRNGEMVIAPSAGQYIGGMGGGRGGGGGGGGYPSALFGIIAYIRQIYLDADHYKAVKDAYSKDPRGMQRPQYDRALEGVIESPRILLPARQEREIDRMVRFAAELKQPAVLYGLHEGYRSVAYLKEGKTPVLVSLRWPARTRGIGQTPEDDESETMRNLELRDKAASTPAELQKAGIKFAFYSDGVDQPRELHRAVKKAIDSGLSFDDALKALTLAPAEIFGVADRLGTIEKGKIANLLVTKGDLFQDRTTVEFVLIDGVKYAPPPAQGPGGGAQQTRPTDPGQEDK
jgi:imidazolonepropionase-like amidohydrolase